MSSPQPSNPAQPRLVAHPVGPPILTVTPRAQIADAAAGKDFRKTDDQDWRSRHPASHKLLGGAVTVFDPALYEDTSTKISNSLNGAVLAPTFLRYSPCLILSQPYGFGMFPFGVSIQPTGKGLTLGFQHVCLIQVCLC